MTKVQRVSVIIPAYYSAETMATCLNSLRDQTFQDFETIVVNSSPEERTRQIVTTCFPEVAFEQAPKRLLPHAARNHGVSLARGELLVFTDPDCKAMSDWLDRLVTAHEAGHAVAGGSIELDGSSWFECGVHLCKFFRVLRGLPPGPCWVVATANASCTREVWETVGPFDGEHFYGDALFSWQAAAHGYQPWFEPQAIVAHHHRGDVASFWCERFERGQEFAQARTAFEQWSWWRIVAYLVLLPVLPLFVLLRAGRDALRSGWGWRFVVTLPLQFIGHLGWSLGEARTHWRLVKCPTTTSSSFSR